jgi:hypothetical protein
MSGSPNMRHRSTSASGPWSHAFACVGGTKWRPGWDCYNSVKTFSYRHISVLLIGPAV